MEQKNLIIAIALSIVVIIVYGMFFTPKPQPRPVTVPQDIQASPGKTGGQQAGAQNQPLTGSESTSPATSSTPQVKDLADIFSSKEAESSVPQTLEPVAEDIKTDEVKDIKIETDLFTAVFTNHGAGLKSFILKKYEDDARTPLDLVSTKASQFNLLPFYFSTFSGNEIFKQINSENFVFDGPTEITVSANENEEITFKYADTAANLAVIKKFVFTNSYIIDTKIEVYHKGERLQAVPIVFGPDLENNILKDRIGNELKIGAFDGEDIKNVNFAKIKTTTTANRAFETGQGNLVGLFHWVAYERGYFAAIFKRTDRDSAIDYYIVKPKNAPKQQPAADNKAASGASGSSGSSGSSGDVGSKDDKTTAQEAEKIPLKNKDKLINDNGHYYIIVTNPEKVYLGPKDEDILASVDNTFEQVNRVIEYGWLGSIAKLLLKGINFIYRFIPNYGWALVIFTIFLKILLFPLTYKSSESMAKMQTLQPKIKAIKKKFKNLKDPEQRRQMNMETMQLYKQEKVNPMGGCLPLLLQMPILFGIFNLLRTSINVRHEPWIFWIQDLSLKDPIFLLPILMGISQVIVQKMSPSTADPTQKKMMYIMPVIITIFVISLPSGLTLYWFVSNLLQIGQQHIINKKIYKEKKEEEHQLKILKRKKSKQ